MGRVGVMLRVWVRVIVRVGVIFRVRGRVRVRGWGGLSVVYLRGECLGYTVCMWC